MLRSGHQPSQAEQEEVGWRLGLNSVNWKVQEVNRGSILGKIARQVDIKLINRLQIHSDIKGRTMTLLKRRHE